MLCNYILGPIFLVTRFLPLESSGNRELWILRLAAVQCMYQYILGSQEIFLEPKVNVKFFTVDPYTPCYRVSRPFPIWSIWQIWSPLGQKNMFFGVIVKRGNQIWIVFRRFQFFFGPPELFLEVSEGFNKWPPRLSRDGRGNETMSTALDLILT